MLLANLSDNVRWEPSIFRNLFSFSKEHFLHQSVNFDVIVHFIKLAQYDLVVWVRSEVVNRVIFNLDLQNARVGCGPIRGDPIIKIVYLKRALRLFVRITLASSAWFEVNRDNQIFEVSNVLFLVLERVLLVFTLIKTVLTDKMFLFLALSLTCIHNECICGIVKVSTFSFKESAASLGSLVHLYNGLSSLLNVRVVKNAPLE